MADQIISQANLLVKSFGMFSGQAVKDYAAGKIEFRNDSGGNVHALVGKISFDGEKLIDNINAFVEHVKRMKPAAVKGTYVKKVFICATMSPSVQLDLS